MSYARYDDEHDGRALTVLREDLANEVQAQTGLEFRIFQDVEDIHVGDQWEQRVRQVVNTAAFLVPIITPSFLQRPWCRTEIQLFAKRLAHPGVGGITSIYYIDSPDFENPIMQKTDEVVKILRALNFWDWRHLSCVDRPDPSRRRALARIAQDIAEQVARLRSSRGTDRNEEARSLLRTGTSLRHRGQAEDALNVLNQVIERYSDCDPLIRLVATNERACALANMGQQRLALAQLDMLIDTLNAWDAGDPDQWGNVKDANLNIARSLRQYIEMGYPV